MTFLNWPIKTYILKIWWSAMWRVYNFTSHNHVYILLCKHASRPIRARVLSKLFYKNKYLPENWSFEAKYAGFKNIKLPRGNYHTDSSET